MFDDLTGKRLLIIGSDNSDAEIVRAAGELGIYTIAVDGNPKSLKTMAKNIADEAWNIDYSHTEEVVIKAKETGVDGVIAGYSEFRVKAAREIAEKLGLPFYATESILNITGNKRRFKEVCTLYGVKVPGYFTLSSVPSEDEIGDVAFPVVVKPVDAAGSKGQTVCMNIDGFIPAVEKALKSSAAGEAIVEEYVTGVEFTARYTIIDGHPNLSMMKDKYPVADIKNAGLTNFSIAPSLAIDSYTEQADPFVRKMLTGIGALCGAASVQGIFNNNGFYIFEMNYRIGGGNDHRLISRENGIDYLKMMIHYALTGRPGITLDNDDPHFKHCCAELQIHLKPGTVGKMIYPQPDNFPGITGVTLHKTEGSEVPDEVNTGRRALTYFLVTDNLKQMRETVEKTQRSVHIEDNMGNNMMYPYFNTEILETR